jgi:hypothetical protein
MAAAIAAALVLYGTGIIPVVELGSVEWFALRVPWLMGCAALLAVLTATFSVIERRVIARSRSGNTSSGVGAHVIMLIAVGAVLAGMLGIAVAGPGSNGPLGLPIPALASFGVGALLLALAGRTVGSAHDD